MVEPAEKKPAKSVVEIDGGIVIREFVPLDEDDEEEESDVEEKAFIGVDTIANLPHNNDLYYLLTFPDSTLLRRLRDTIKPFITNESIAWNDPDTYHATLVYVSDIDPVDVYELSRGVDVEGSIPVIVGGYGVFANGDENVLFLRLNKDSELVRKQGTLFNFVAANGFDTSPFSIPNDWNPHITLATSDTPFDESVFPDLADVALMSGIIEASVDFDEVAVSEKFNPFHDELGRFTFSPIRFSKDRGTFSEERKEIFENTVRDAILNIHDIPEEVGPGVVLRESIHGQAGEYNPYRDAAFVATDTKTDPEIVTIHEIGHHMDHAVLGDDGTNPLYMASRDSESDSQNVMASIRDSKLSRSYQNHLDGTELIQIEDAFSTGEAFPASDIYIEYLNSDTELFARAYTQWIVTKNGDPSLNRKFLDSITSLKRGVDMQWGADEFAPISAEFDALFESRGLLR